MLFTIQSTVFNSFWDFAAAELFSVMSEMLFYGILLVLVAFAVNLLYRRQASGGRILLVATAVMFLLATLQFAFRILAAQKAYEVFYLAVAGKFSPQSAAARDATARNVDFNFVEDILLVVNNVVTDGILIYRCFLIWGKNYYVIAAPTLMLLLTAILSAITAVEGDYPSAAGPAIDLRIGFSLGVLTNIVLVGLTAGRIWYTRRVVHGLQSDVVRGMKSDVKRQYNTALAMVLESGAILCAWVVVYVIVRSISPPTCWRVFRGGLAQLLNIVPTLIIVRVGLEKTIRDSDEGTKVDTFKAKESSSSV